MKVACLRPLTVRLNYVVHLKANRGVPTGGTTACVGCINGYTGAKCDVGTYLKAYGTTFKAKTAFCPAGYSAIMDKADCDKAYTGIKTRSTVGTWGDWPTGCFFGVMFQKHHFFNKGGTTLLAKLGGLPKGNKGGSICKKVILTSCKQDQYLSKGACRRPALQAFSSARRCGPHGQEVRTWAALSLSLSLAKEALHCVSTRASWSGCFPSCYHVQPGHHDRGPRLRRRRSRPT